MLFIKGMTLRWFLLGLRRRISTVGISGPVPAKFGLFGHVVT